MPLEKLLEEGKRFLRIALLSTILPLTAHSQASKNNDETRIGPYIDNTDLSSVVEKGKSLAKGVQKVPIYLLDTSTSMSAALRSKLTGEKFDSIPIFSDYLSGEYKTYLEYKTTLHDENPNVWQYVEDPDIQNLAATLISGSLLGGPEKNQSPEPIKQAQKWPAGVWIHNDEGAKNRIIKTTEQIENQGLFNAGMYIDENGVTYQLWQYEGLTTHTASQNGKEAEVFYTQDSTGTRIDGSNNSVSQTLRKIDDRTIEATVSNQKTGEIKRHTFTSQPIEFPSRETNMIDGLWWKTDKDKTDSGEGILIQGDRAYAIMEFEKEMIKKFEFSKNWEREPTKLTIIVDYLEAEEETYIRQKTRAPRENGYTIKK